MEERFKNRAGGLSLLRGGGADWTLREMGEKCLARKKTDWERKSDVLLYRCEKNCFRGVDLGESKSVRTTQPLFARRTGQDQRNCGSQRKSHGGKKKGGHRAKESARLEAHSNDCGRRERRRDRILAKRPWEEEKKKNPRVNRLRIRKKISFFREKEGV